MLTLQAQTLQGTQYDMFSLTGRKIKYIDQEPGGQEKWKVALWRPFRGTCGDAHKVHIVWDYPESCEQWRWCQIITLLAKPHEHCNGLHWGTRQCN